MGALTPDSPLLDIKRLEREIGTGVSMATGGTVAPVLLLAMVPGRDGCHRAVSRARRPGRRPG